MNIFPDKNGCGSSKPVKNEYLQAQSLVPTDVPGLDLDSSQQSVFGNSQSITNCDYEESSTTVRKKSYFLQEAETSPCQRFGEDTLSATNSVLATNNVDDLYAVPKKTVRAVSKDSQYNSLLQEIDRESLLHIEVCNSICDGNDNIPNADTSKGPLVLGAQNGQYISFQEKRETCTENEIPNIFPCSEDSILSSQQKLNISEHCAPSLLTENNSSNVSPNDKSEGSSGMMMVLDDTPQRTE